MHNLCNHKRSRDLGVWKTKLFSDNDRKILRALAKRVAEIADEPVMRQRREMWKKHNRLERVRPMILVFPEGSWDELLSWSSLQCEEDRAKRIEMELRMKIFQHEHINDDSVIEKTWKVHKTVRGCRMKGAMHVHTDDWGLATKLHHSSEKRGSYGFEPVLLKASDLKKLRAPDFIYDEKETMKELDEMQDLFGDILDVGLYGICHVSFHFMQHYIYLRGLEHMMYDLYDEPEFVYETMAIFEEGYKKIISQCLEQNLFDLNNDGTYHSSGGVGYTDELPAKDFDGVHVRTCDLWASAESQEMAQVSPEMHDRFVMQYEKRILSRFGLNGYGCCENLTDKLEYIFNIPNMRRISISPWADVEKCAEKLKNNCIFSWKPNPAYLTGEFNPELIREYVRHTLDVTRDCVLEIILKDTHTCDHHPERFTDWVKIVRQLIESKE